MPREPRRLRVLGDLPPSKHDATDRMGSLVPISAVLPAVMPDPDLRPDLRRSLRWAQSKRIDEVRRLLADCQEVIVDDGESAQRLIERAKETLNDVQARLVEAEEE